MITIALKLKTWKVNYVFRWTFLWSNCLKAIWSLWLRNITLEVVLYAGGGVGGGGVHYHIISIFSRPKIQNFRRKLFRQLSRDRNLHDSGMSHATTASSKQSSTAPWRVCNAVVGGGNAGWTTSKSEHSCPCQNSSQGPPAKKNDWKRISAESAVIIISPTSQSVKRLN